MVEAKVCAMCGELKALDDFYPRPDGAPLSYCKGCSLEKSRKWNREHRQRVNASRRTDEQKRRNLIRAKARADARKAEAVRMLGGKCARCGGEFPLCVYDFHHKDRKEKKYTAKQALDRSWKTAEEEIRKCILLCANCHRLEHWEQGTEEGEGH